MYKEIITTEIEAKNFLKKFYKEYPSVHPEDDMSLIVNTKDHSRTFIDEQVVDIHSRLDEIYSILEDPCAYIVDELQDN
tara:strand:+ start:313 stop:549 length:237 start_codon:yes stop_codon:yes gene_type:complete